MMMMTADGCFPRCRDGRLQSMLPSVTDRTQCQRCACLSVRSPHALHSTNYKAQHKRAWRRRGSVVRTSVFGWQTFPGLRLTYGWHVTTLWVKCPL